MDNNNICFPFNPCGDPHTLLKPSQIKPYSCIVNIFVFLGVDDQPADSLHRVAAFKVEDLPQKSSQMGKDVIDKVCQTHLKEWGPKSLSTLPEDTIQELLMEVSRFIEIFFIS